MAETDGALGLPPLTLRDYFAGQALAGMLSQGLTTGRVEFTVKGAYLFADAMLKEREAGR